MSQILPVLPRISHIGVAVSNMARSLRFYKEGFGFIEGVQVTVENDHNALFGISGPISMQSRFLRLGDVIIELIEFTTPAAVVSSEMRDLYHTGLTHLSFRVLDVEITAAHLAQLGGKIHPSTFTQESGDGREGSIIFCTDPDGTRIELMAYNPDVDFA